MQRTNVMSDLVKTISSWQVWADSFTHTHAHTQIHTHTHMHDRKRGRERETLEELSAELVQLVSQFQFQFLLQ